MKKTKKITAFLLVVVMVFTLIPLSNITANAADNSWKQYLKDFLLKFPSLFDNNVENNYYKGIYPKDAVTVDNNMFIPFQYDFYDIDNDNIPEVIIYFGVMGTDWIYESVYKLYGTSYEFIGSISLWGFYKNSQNKLVIATKFSDYYLGEICFAEIKDKKIIYNDYIDSKGNKTYEGVKYNEIYKLSDLKPDVYETLDVEKVDPTLKEIPEFDCSDIINSIKNDTPLKTSTPSAWAQAVVDNARKLEVLPPSLDDKYQQNITRAEFCTLAVSFYEKITQKEISIDIGVVGPRPGPGKEGISYTGFDDTSDENVLKMATLGIVNGVGNYKFNPTGEITRQDAATILVRLLEALGCSVAPIESTFSDIDKSAEYARVNIGKVQALQIMFGMGNNDFAPLEKYTREQSIITLMRVWDLIDTNNKKSVPKGETKALLINRMWGNTIQVYLDEHWTNTIYNALDKTEGGLLDFNSINGIDTLLSILPKLEGIASSEYLLKVVVAMELSKVIIETNDKGSGIIVELTVINPALLSPIPTWLWVRPQ